MAKYVFTGQSGSNRKILLMGSDFNLSLSLIDSVQKQTDSKNTEVVLVEATDSDAASRVETALTNRYNSIFQQNASYSAEKLDMVKNCKVTKDGNFVTMIIGEKAFDMLKMFNDSIK